MAEVETHHVIYTQTHRSAAQLLLLLIHIITELLVADFQLLQVRLQLCNNSRFFPHRVLKRLATRHTGIIGVLQGFVCGSRFPR